MIHILPIIIIGIIIFFLVLQKLSDKTYKPTRNEIISKLQEMINGNIDYSDFDELISVRIAYDHSLEEIRIKLNDIIDDAININNPHSNTKVIDLSEAGKKRLKELIEELEKQPD
jgi:hypothetical protein